MTVEKPPFQELYDLGELTRGGVEFRVTTTEAERARIARWADVAVLDSFAAAMTLRKHAANTFSLDAQLTADIVQACVVTLEPLRSHIDRHLHRELHLTAAARHRGDNTIALSQAAGDDDVTEEIDSLEYDLAAPLLEELVLAINPYPRAPGVEFAPVAEAEEAVVKKESPFAVLRNLKTPG